MGTIIVLNTDQTVLEMLIAALETDNFEVYPLPSRKNGASAHLNRTKWPGLWRVCSKSALMKCKCTFYSQKFVKVFGISRAKAELCCGYSRNSSAVSPTKLEKDEL